MGMRLADSSTRRVHDEEEFIDDQSAVISGQGIGGSIASGAGGLLGSLTGGGLSGAMNALSAASSVMTTGTQLMQALPIRELAKAGMTLAESGYLRNRGSSRGGRAKDKTALPPPPGVGTPSVTCRKEGMTCCVPRQAVAEWQRYP